MHSLLNPIFTVDGVQQSLPDIFHRLSSTEGVEPIESFDYLRRHQKRAWHLFLVQTAAMIGPCASAEEWEDALAVYGREMWELETELGQPAFMQPPVDSIKGWEIVPTPDEAGVLSTAAGHTVKDETITEPRPEHWIYALVTTQTTANRKGRGNCRVIRMNSAYNDRPYVSLVPALEWGPRFRADVAIARAAPQRGDVQFLWSLPYDEPVALEDCHTLFIEICRRFRFRDGKMYKKAATVRMRSAKKRKGAVGDPWIPIDVTGKKHKAVSTGEAGFSYTVVQKLLAGEDYKTPSLQVRSEQPMYFVAESLAGDRGGTRGFHERTVFIPAKAMKWLSKDDRDLFAERSRSRVNLAADVKKSALRPALKVLKEIDFGDSDGYKKLYMWEASYEDAVDRVFFEDLWASVDQEQEEAHEAWKARLVRFAERELTRAEDTVSDTRKWKLRPEARSLFYHKLKTI